jgi:hypothetical protein
MGIFDACVSLYGASSRTGAVVETLLLDRDIRSLSKRGKIHWPMEPDFVLVLRLGEDRMVLMGECDNGTESIESPRVNSLSTKIDNYKLFYRQMRRGDPWLKDFAQPQTMLIFQSQQRMLNAMEMVASHGGRSAYWFTLAEYLEPPYSFLGEVWQRIGLEGHHSPTSLFMS